MMFRSDVRTVFMVLLFAAYIFGDSLPHQTHNASMIENSNSEKMKTSTLDVSAHGSKLIQPVSLVADTTHQMQTDNFTNLVRLEDVLMVFNLNEVAAKWPVIQHEFKAGCARDIMEYFRGLKQYKMWAIKSKFVVSIDRIESFLVDFCYC